MCKYGYPRERSSEPLAKSAITGRNIYRCELKGDEMCTIFSRGMSIDASWLCTVTVSPASGLTRAWQLPVSLPSCAWEQACGAALAVVARHGKCSECGYGLTVLD